MNLMPKINSSGKLWSLDYNPGSPHHRHLSFFKCWAPQFLGFPFFLSLISAESFAIPPSFHLPKFSHLLWSPSVCICCLFYSWFVLTFYIISQREAHWLIMFNQRSIRTGISAVLWYVFWKAWHPVKLH